MSPSIPWPSLVLSLFLEITVIIGAALLCRGFIRSGFWRKTMWQAAVLTLLVLAGSEFTGLGRGVFTCLFSTPPERVVRTAPPSVTINHITALPVMPMPAIDTTPTAPNYHQWMGWLWGAGAGLILLRVLLSHSLFQWLHFRRRKLDDSPLQSMTDGLAQRMGMRRRIRLLQARGIRSPLAFGLARPAIALPGDFASRFAMTQQEAMLAHELAHLAGRDPLWYLLHDLAAALFWWHPLVWVARRQFHACCEFVADEAAALIENGPDALAECLVQLGRQINGTPVWASLGVDGGRFQSHLGKRVERLLEADFQSRASAPLRRGFLPRLTLFTGATLVLLLGTGWIHGQGVRAANWKDTMRLAWAGSPGAVAMARDTEESAKQTTPPPQTNATAATEEKTVFFMPSSGNTRVDVRQSPAGIVVSNSEAGFQTRFYKVDTNAMFAKMQKLHPSIVTNENTGTNFTAAIKRIVESAKAGKAGVFDGQLSLPATFNLISRVEFNRPVSGIQIQAKVEDFTLIEEVLGSLGPSLEIQHVNTPSNSPGQTDKNALQERLFLVDPIEVNTALFHIHHEALTVPKNTPPDASSQHQLDAMGMGLEKYFEDQGIPMKSPGRMVYCKPEDGMIMFRATADELESIERLFARLNIHTRNGDSFTELFNPSQPLPISTNGNTNTSLATRTFRVEPVVFERNLKQQYPKAFTQQNPTISVEDSNGRHGGARLDLASDPINVAFHKILEDVGVKDRFSFYNDRNGLILIRATPEELTLADNLIASLYRAPAQMCIENRFFLTDDIDWLRKEFKTEPETVSAKLFGPEGEVAGSSNQIISAFTCILTFAQAKELMQRMTSMKETVVLSAPKLTTLDGRQAHVTVDKDRITSSSLSLDIIPTVVANSPQEIQLIAIAAVTDAGTRQLLTRRTVPNGQFLLLAGVATKQEGKKNRNIVVLISPMLIDAAGNPFYPEPKAK